MPEIGEVARIVHYIHKHLVGKTLAVVKAQHDENVFGKVGTSAEEFEKALTGKKVLDARQQGKYFWLVMSSPPHPLFHFGMTGWFKIRDVETAYYKRSTPVPDTDWPPKYWKFKLATDESPPTEAAFVDSRRFARIRLIEAAGEEMRYASPLKENGPDPVIDKDILTEEWLVEKMRSKKIPVKALLLDQANISGIGNWVGDEILYDAKVHPEQYSNTLSDAQLNQLHTSIHYVCGLAVETKSDSSLFPETWLFKHRWGKGKKDSTNRLPNGDKIVFVTVGGRTSAVVPNVQKKTGPVAGDVKGEVEEDEDEGADVNEKLKPTPKKRGKKVAAAEDDAEDDVKPVAARAPLKPTGTPRKRKSAYKDEHEMDEGEDEAVAQPSETNDIKDDIETSTLKGKKRKVASKSETNGTNGVNGDEATPQIGKKQGTGSKPKSAPAKSKSTPAHVTDKTQGRRRSGRVSGKGV